MANDVSPNILGSDSRPLRVVVVGSGPSGFYAAEALLKSKEFTVQVDMIDRLPTPFGLVRGGEFLFLPPICLAIAVVTSAAHRDAVPSILTHALRSWFVLMFGILAFMTGISYFFEWVLP